MLPLAQVKLFSEFHNVEDEDDDILENAVALRDSWINRQSLFHLLDFVLNSVSITLLWRLPAVAFAMGLSWESKTINVWTFLLPYVLSLICVAWPILIAELGIGQSVRGTSYKTFGSLGRRAGSAGLTALLGLFTCFCLSVIGAFAFAYIVHASSRPAAYQSGDTTRAIGSRLCKNTESFAPYMLPRVCTTKNLWWVGSTDYGSFEGEGYCIAAPWGGSSSWFFDNHNGELPQIFQELPLYCGDLALHRIATKGAYGLFTRDTAWRHTGGSHFNWQMMLGFVLLWICVSLLCLLPSGGVGQIVRIILGGSTTAVILVIFFCCIAWFVQNPFRKATWLTGMAWDADSTRLRRPDVWASAVIQAILSLNLAQNHVSPVAATSPSAKSNIVFQAFLIMTWNAFISYVILWSMYLGLMSLTQNRLFTNHDPFLTVSLETRNNAYGLLFSLMQTLFDNSATLDGTSRRPLILPFIFWPAVFAITVLNCFRLMNGAVDTLFRSRLNWSLGWPRWLWILGLSIFFVLTSIGCWFGLSWSFFVTFQHFIFNWTLPLFVLLEAISIGWLFGFRDRIKHYGLRSPVVQGILFFAGTFIFAFSFAFLWNDSSQWKRWTALAFGFLLICASFIIPIFLIRSHDVYGRVNSMSHKAFIVLFASTDHLRKELNHRTCHQRSVWKLSCVWSLLIRFVVPFMAIMSWAPWWSRADQSWNWSPYRPFFNDHNDMFSRVERQMMSYFGRTVFQFNKIILGIVCSMSIILIILTISVVIFPNLYQAVNPLDTDPQFWNVRQALELFSNSMAHSQVPVRVRSPGDGETQSGSGSREDADFSSLTPSNKSNLHTPSPILRDRTMTTFETD